MPELTPNPFLERQSTLRLQLPNHVTIIGCGGVGSWVALFLTLAGVPKLTLWDSDEVSISNLNRLPLGPGYVNFNKAGALKHMLGTIRPSCEVVDWNENWSPTRHQALSEPTPDWIVAATDSHASRVLIHTWATHCQVCEGDGGCAMNLHSLRCRYLEVSADGEYGGCTDSPAMFTSELETHHGYQSVPVWVGPCVSSAMMACSVILHPDHKPTFNYRLGYLRQLQTSIGGTRGQMELQDL